MWLGTDNGDIKMMSSERATCQLNKKQHEGRITAIIDGGQSDMLISASADSTVKLWAGSRSGTLRVSSLHLKSFFPF